MSSTSAMLGVLSSYPIIMAVICWTLDIGIDKLFAIYTQNTVAMIDFVINFHKLFDAGEAIKMLSPSNGRNIFLVGFIAFYLIEQLLRFRKHLAFANGLPKLLQGRITLEKYNETTAHNQRKNSFGAIKDFFAFGRTMITLFVFYPILWQLANKHFSEYSYAQSLVIPAAFSIMSETIEFCFTSPLTAYYTFVIDAKFNKYSPGLYVWEQFKKLGLGLVLNSLFMWALVSIIDWAGPNAWRYMIGFIIGVVICVQILFPVTVAKCFNTFTPLPEGDLKVAIDELVSQTNLDCRQCYMVDGSTQSSHSNAYVAGMCGTRRIVIYDTLVKDLQYDKSRINAVVGHEIGHAKLNHNWVLTGVNAVMFSSMFYLFSFFQNNNAMVASFGFTSNGSTKASTFIKLHCFMMVYSSCFMPFMSVMVNGIVRQLEFAADRYAVSLGYDIRLALLDLSKENLGDLNPDPWYSSYHYTHPDLVSRLEAVTLQMGGAPMPEDVVKQYVKMPEAVSKKDAATKEVAKEGVKEEKQVSNNDANAQSTAPTATAHVYDLEEDSDDDDDDDDDEPSGVVMEPPLSPPPPQGIQARIGLYN